MEQENITRAWPATHFGKVFDLLVCFLGAIPAFELLRWGVANDLIFTGWIGLGFLFLTWICFILSTIAVVVGFKFVLTKKIPAGVYPFGSKEVKTYGIYLLLSTFVYRSFLRNWMCCFIFPGYYFYKLMGAKMADPPIIGIDAKLLDPCAIEIGSNVVLGENSVLCAHFLQGKTLVINTIKIGNNVTIGAGSFISPGVTVGDNSVVAAGAVVVPGTIIGDNEKWGGVPAKKIKPST